ncbi:CHRD domain-containing protein [Ornithinicoccus halotolerans]|uniref:CHRD domain-containing protein n=1 Tax=Ornithinicoccus halotolerans TaxID=1748220 RepID=UPI0012969B01|nr:CHRD domain-containing protein [Ornithinicoccus halotolerans]
MSRTARRLLAVTAGTLLAAPLVPGPLHAAPDHAGKTITTELRGAAEVPGPGDPDGTGTATVHLNPGLQRVCYTLEVTDVEQVTAAHIHVGDPTVAGPVVVPLDAPTDGMSSGCADADRALLVDIVSNPDEYYVNVHSVAFPAGAVRGQLG